MELDGLYHDIVETSVDGIWVFDLEGRTLYANPALASMFGASREEFARLTVFDTLDEQGRRDFAAHLADVRAGRVNEHDVEAMFVRQDGSSFWVLVSEALLTGPDGSTRVLHRLADFDDRRRTVDALTQSRRQLAEGQRIARIGTWDWDVARDRIQGSPSLLELYGLDDDYFPTTYAAVLDKVHPFDRERVEEAVDKALTGDTDGFLFEARVFGADDWVWTRGRGAVHRDEHGEARSVTGTFQDVTETKRAEIALQDQVAQNVLMQAVAAAANEARGLADVLVHARTLVLLHDDWERARGFEVVGRDDVRPLYFLDEDRAEDEATPEESAAELALARECLRAERLVWDERRLTVAFPVRHAGQVVVVVTITSAPPLYRHDMIEAMVDSVAVQLERVVERERAEHALAAARDAAMEASRKKSEFLATMSHEIRTPLNGVVGLNDLLMRTRLDADQQRLAAGVRDASRTLLDLINDILDFSKIEAGKLVLEQVDFEVREVLDQVANVLGEAARAKGLTLYVGCDASVPAVLNGDPTRLTQVITNLGANAVKFTDEGEVSLRATATTAEDGRTELVVEVTDTGIGIAPEQVDELFDTFTQADASTTRLHGGTGLGLAITRQIVHALGGEVGVDSEHGRGSRFWCTVLLDPPASMSETVDDAARRHLSGRRALVVGGDARQRDDLVGHLGWWGLRCTEATGADDARAALDTAIAEEDPFDVVLVDRSLALPRRNGLDLARLLRSSPAYDRTVLLLLSATTDLDTEAVQQHGIADCLVRPVGLQTLRTTLLRHLAGIEPPAAPQPAASPPPGARTRVLVVEDNAVNQMVAVGLLDALGYDADTADDGYAALEVFDPVRHAVVLMDVQMPRLDGYAATRAIRERGGPRVPILAMTAAAVEGERERCLEAGMDDFLTKPVDPDALAGALARWTRTGSGAPTPVAPQADVEPAREPGSAELDLERLEMLREMDTAEASYLGRAIGNFDANAAEHLAAVRAAVSGGDPAALVASAHKLAGSASNIGVVEVAEVARALEGLGRQGVWEGTDELIVTLQDAMDRGRAALLAFRDAG